jgi:uncharacterized damage-inducible protein DinB
MIPILEPILSEFREEAGITGRVLERVPGDRLSWKPHAKSMSLGQLAKHVAEVPGLVARIVQQDEFDASQANFIPTPPKDTQEIQAVFQQSIQSVENYLQALSEDEARRPWRVTAGGKHIISRPRIEIIRSLMLNHWYHHRGQLSVYLRLLEVPVPVIYGPSADENPFGGKQSLTATQT